MKPNLPIGGSGVNKARYKQDRAGDHKSSTKAKRTSLLVRFASDSPVEGDGFELTFRARRNREILVSRWSSTDLVWLRPPEGERRIVAYSGVVFTRMAAKEMPCPCCRMSRLACRCAGLIVPMLVVSRSGFVDVKQRMNSIGVMPSSRSPRWAWRQRSHCSPVCFPSVGALLRHRRE